MLHLDAQKFGGNFAAVITFTITNFILIGYYLHYVNSSPLNWKQYRFVSGETKQKLKEASRVPRNGKSFRLFLIHAVDYVKILDQA